MEPKPTNPRDPKDAVVDLRRAMSNHREGPSGFLHSIEVNPMHIYLVGSLHTASEVIVLDEYKTEARAAFFNGALFGIEVAKKLLNSEEIKKLFGAINTLVADSNKSEDASQASDSLIEASQESLRHHDEYAKEIAMFFDEIAPEDSKGQEDFAMFGVGFMLLAIDLSAEAVKIERKKAEDTQIALALARARIALARASDNGRGVESLFEK